MLKNLETYKAISRKLLNNLEGFSETMRQKFILCLFLTYKLIYSPNNVVIY